MNYLILSSGAYSDYSPTYFAGEKEITQAELTAKSLEISDKQWSEWEALPEIEAINWKNKPIMTKYNPDQPKIYVSDNGPDSGVFIEKMSEWLKTEGYEPVPNGLPEINVYYDLPSTKKFIKPKLLTCQTTIRVGRWRGC